jgi:hypothetical protein
MHGGQSRDKRKTKEGTKAITMTDHPIHSQQQHFKVNVIIMRMNMSCSWLREALLTVARVAR